MTKDQEKEKEQHLDHTEDDKKINIVMVVNGSPHELSFALGQKLIGVVQETLSKTGNAGQPPENWELRDDKGTLLDLEKHLEDYSFNDKVSLFLNPKASIGG